MGLARDFRVFGSGLAEEPENEPFLESVPSGRAGHCEANGITIHCLRADGDKPPLIPLHGLTGSGACWIPLSRALESYLLASNWSLAT